MKKKLLLSVLVSSMLLISGCFGSEEKEHVDIDEVPQLTATGILQLQTGVYADLPGTHYLKKGDGEILALASLLINLKDEQYENKEVEVSGIAREGNDGEEFLEVEKITVIGEGIKQGSWDIYQNSEAGFKIAYKNDWEIDDKNKENISFLAPKKDEQVQDKISIKRLTSSPDETLTAFLERKLSSEAKNATLSKIGSSQLESMKLTNATKDDLSYYVKRQGHVFEITFDGNGNADSLDNKNIFAEMLLDFQFIAYTSEDSDEETEEAGDLGDVDAVGNEGQAKLVNILKSNPDSFSSELADSKVQRVEFVEPKYVYVDFMAGESKKRFLFEYSFDGSKASDVNVLAKYVPGETTDWKLDEGENPVIGKEKTVYTFGSAGKTVTTVVKAGFRYFESQTYGFKLQYPASWYYAGKAGNGSPVSYHYGFSDKPVTAENELLSVDVSSTKVEGADYDKVVAVEADKGTYYLLLKGTDFALVAEIAETIEAIK